MERTSKLNNGYCIVVTYSHTGNSQRVFGPYPTPQAAMLAILEGYRLKSSQAVEERKKRVRENRPWRPVIGREYLCEPQLDRPYDERIHSIRIDVLEILNLFS